MIMWKKLGLITVFIGLWGCGNTANIETTQTNQAEISSEEKPLVVATTSILCDLTEQIAKQTIELKCLVGAGVDPHVYQATPEDRQSIDKADLVLYGGYNFDSSLIKLVEATANTAPKIAVHEKAVSQPLLSEDDHHHHHHHGEENDTEEAVADPHVWHDPKNAIAMVAVIRESLTTIQPDYAQQYQNQANEIKTELTELDQWISSQIATIPEKQRKLVTTHDALGYYVKAYNLTFQGALTGFSTEESPSAGMVANLVKEIKNSQIPMIFVESSVNPQLIETVAKEAQVKVSSRSLYTDSLGEKGTEADTYQKMLIANTRTLVEGLGGNFSPFQNDQP
jgi:manganese/iron transport system substrate-binding protein